MDKFASNILKSPYEMSSTRKPDREKYLDLKRCNKIPYPSFCQKIS